MRLDTWIHRIVINAALQSLRRQRFETASPADEREPVDSRTPLEAQVGAELVDTLRRRMGALTEYERVCFVLKHVDDWQLREIAAETGNNVNSVKQALFRALGKLRSGLAEWRMEA